MVFIVGVFMFSFVVFGLMFLLMFVFDDKKDN